MDVWTTKLREEIEGFQVDIIMSGKGCILNDKVRKEIAKALKKGRKSGSLGVFQADRNKDILSCWKVPFEKVEVGDKVEFSTSGKYNPGYHATNTYEGVVERVDDQHKCAVRSYDNKKAFIPMKHIEKIL